MQFKKFTFLKTFSEVTHILPVKFKRRFWWLVGLIFVTGIIDLAGLASFIPIISLIANPEILEGDGILSQLKQLTGITTYSGFVITLFLAVFLLLAFRVGFIVFSYRVQAKFVYSLAKYVGFATYRSYLYSSYEQFTKKEKAQVIRELTISPMHFAKFLVLPLLQVSSEIIVLVMIVGGIAYYNIEVFLLLLVTIIPTALGFQAAVKKRLRRLGKLEYEQSPKLYANSVRGISGFIDVKLRQKESTLLHDYHSIFDLLSRINVSTSTYSIIPAKLFELVTIGGLLLIVIYGFYIKQDITLVLPLITLYAAAGYRIMPSLVRVVPSMMQLEQFQYLFGVYKDSLTPLKQQPIGKEPELSFNSTIELKNVGFAFHSHNRFLFQRLDFSIKKGEFLGIIGQSGSGKTTLVNLITGFLLPTEGSLLIDGVSVTGENRRAWWNKISYVQQSSYLEKGSLASNIAFLEQEFDLDQLHAAIQGASLTEFVNGQSPVDILIEEEGKNLSGGQKQRIIIARALYHNSELIVLDEATSALDNETEQAINETIFNLRNTNLTVIIIAHRYSTLKYTDRIIKMKNGKIDEETSFSALLSE
jgi:ABC-type bacteriocin/lantibiotic exporter with double-glycine peptidase domain